MSFADDPITLAEYEVEVALGDMAETLSSADDRTLNAIGDLAQLALASGSKLTRLGAALTLVHFMHSRLPGGGA